MDFKREKNRIYAESDNGELMAEVTFPEVRAGVVDINRTFVDDSLRGQGIAGKLMDEAYDAIKDADKQCIPTCSYAVKWFGDHPDNNDIVAE